MLVIGWTSLLLAVFNLIISIILYWAFYSYVNSINMIRFPLYRFILDTFGFIEVYSKPIGLLVGVYGLIISKGKDTYAKYAVVINMIVIIWTVAFLNGWIKL